MISLVKVCLMIVSFAMVSLTLINVTLANIFSWVALVNMGLALLLKV
jgi:hypothetical protein